MKIAFMGTPEFALPSLKTLIEDGHELAVFTQPDRPKDRGHGIAMPPVKELALSYGLPVYQFDKIRLPEGQAALKAAAPDLMVTAAFGQLLSAENLAVPQYGCINVHASLLPKYRGAAPIQWAVINGEKVTGVTTMMTNIGLDTGDILLQRQTEIGADETSGELYDRLAKMGAGLLHDTIEALQEGKLKRTPQDDALATKCTVIKKEMARLDFSMPACRVHDLVRGMNPAPVAFSTVDGETVRIYKTRLASEYSHSFDDAQNGECVIAKSKAGLYVKCGDGEVLQIIELQFAGSKRMEAKAALNSRQLLFKVFGS